MKRIISIAIAMLLTLSLAAGCVGTNNTQSVKVGALAGPTGMGLAYMMKEQSELYAVELATAPDQVTAKFISGDIDIAAVPINLAATLYKKTEGEAVMIAVNTLGVLYLIENGNSINSLSDLAGKTVYATGQGSTPEYTLNHLLSLAKVEGVKVEYIQEHSALATQLADGSVSLGMLPEPHVSSVMVKNKDARIALDLNAQWKELTGSDLVQGCYIVRKAFLNDNRDLVIRFLNDAKASSDKLLSDADAASVVVEQGILGAEPVAKRAIPQCNVVCLTGQDMVTISNAMLQVLFESNPKSVGGQLPNEDFYFIEG